MKKKHSGKVICPVCGTENLKSHNYCENEECGFRLDVAKQESAFIGMTSEDIEKYNRELSGKKKLYEKNKKPEILKNMPKYYGERDPFESEEEFIERNVAYGYVYDSDFSLEDKDYFYNLKRFKISKISPDNVLHSFPTTLSETEIKQIYYFIEIEPDQARLLAEKKTNRKIYSKYIYETGELEKKFYIINNNQAYVIQTNMNEVIHQSQKKKEAIREKQQTEKKKKYILWIVGIVIGLALFAAFPDSMAALVMIALIISLVKKK